MVVLPELALMTMFGFLSFPLALVLLVTHPAFVSPLQRAGNEGHDPHGARPRQRQRFGVHHGTCGVVSAAASQIIGWNYSAGAW